MNKDDLVALQDAVVAVHVECNNDNSREKGQLQQLPFPAPFPHQQILWRKLGILIAPGLSRCRLMSF